MPKLKPKHAFTLIELLVVMALIGIMAGIVTSGMVNQQKKARDAQRKNDLKAFQKAMESAKTDCKNSAYYPITAGANELSRFVTIVDHLADSDLKYLSTIMQDTKYDGTGTYAYRYAISTVTTLVCPNRNTPPTPNSISGVANFVARAQLEIGPTDPDSTKSYNNCANTISRLTAGAFLGAPSGTDGYFYVCSN